VCPKGKECPRSAPRASLFPAASWRHWLSKTVLRRGQYEFGLIVSGCLQQLKFWKSTRNKTPVQPPPPPPPHRLEFTCQLFGELFELSVELGPSTAGAGQGDRGRNGGCLPTQYALRHVRVSKIYN
jgi:hypothetical protein